MYYPLTLTPTATGQQASYRGRSCDMVARDGVVISSARDSAGRCIEAPDFVTCARISLNVPTQPDTTDRSHA